MCLIPTYTEIEKKNQLIKVMNLMKCPISTEAERQQFLYNLAFMNNMVVKGYMKERTDMDERIYNVKDWALDYIIKRMPERCFLSYDGGNYIVYVYANSRQYSFHTRNDHNMKFKYCHWDGIVGGWELSDEEYKKTVENRKKDLATKRAKADAEHKRWERDIKLRVIHQVNQLKRNRERVEEFKRVMEGKITPAQRRTKTYQNYRNDKYNVRWMDCWKLWGEKWGYGCYPPETTFRAWRCNGGVSDSAAERYAQEYYDSIKNKVWNN